LAIPIIDIFAGPGGLGEGFCALQDDNGERVFKIVLSIEKDKHAHETLTLRSFFRQFKPGEAPSDYYEFVKGNIELEDLYKKWPVQAASAKNEAWKANLGNKKRSMSHERVDERIKTALKGEEDWLLIGGPPCQAYSVIGRVRKKRKTLNEKRDERVGLYKQYLRILALHNPSVFIMENVKGLLTAKTKESPVFEKILKDLADPITAFRADFHENGQKLSCPGYEIYSLVKTAKKSKTKGKSVLSPKD
jgi:DNA (cytosine-5)-methyltransferase 1